MQKLFFLQSGPVGGGAKLLNFLKLSYLRPDNVCRIGGLNVIVKTTS